MYVRSIKNAIITVGLCCLSFFPLFKQAVMIFPCFFYMNTSFGLTLYMVIIDVCAML